MADDIVQYSTLTVFAQHDAVRCRAIHAFSLGDTGWVCYALISLPVLGTSVLGLMYGV